MMSYHGVLDDHRFSVSDAYIRILYNAFGWPAKLARQVRPANQISSLATSKSTGCGSSSVHPPGSQAAFHAVRTFS